MRVLVVGGAGFTGRAVVEALLAAGHRVRAWDLAPDSWLPVRPRETHTTLGARACTHAAIFCDLAAGWSTVEHGHAQKHRLSHQPPWC